MIGDIEPMDRLYRNQTHDKTSHIAAAMDHARWENVIGTLAGDDTVLLIVKDTETVPKLIKLIVSLMKE